MSMCVYMCISVCRAIERFSLSVLNETRAHEMLHQLLDQHSTKNHLHDAGAAPDSIPHTHDGHLHQSLCF